MTTPELAYAEIEKLVTRFKGLRISEHKDMKEIQTRLGFATWMRR